jgi:hypothetical protein
MSSGLDHSFRSITGDNGNAIEHEKEGIFPSSAIEFQDLIAGSKCVRKDFPYGCALDTDS